MNITKIALTALLAGVVAAGNASAELISSPLYGSAAYGQQSDQGTGLAYEQAFTAPASSVLTAIRWWGFHSQDSGGSAFDNFVVMLDGQVQTGSLSVVPGGFFNEYTLDVPDVALTASMLSIFNDSSDVEWFWQSASAVGNPDSPHSTAVAFSLLGQPAAPIDEPGVPTLIAAALAGLAWARRASARR